MSNQLVVIETLIKKRESLIFERDKMIDLANKAISEIESALEQLSGKKVWEIASSELYDDENPNYITSSQEEI